MSTRQQPGTEMNQVTEWLALEAATAKVAGPRVRPAKAVLIPLGAR